MGAIAGGTASGFFSRPANVRVVSAMATRNAWSGAAKENGGQAMRLDASALAVLTAIAAGCLGMVGGATARAREPRAVPDGHSPDGWLLLVAELCASSTYFQ